MFANTSRLSASLLLAAATTLSGSMIAHAQQDETTLRIARDAQVHVLRLNDLDATLPVGETREFQTEAGSTAIIGRSDDALIVDIEGRITEVPLPAIGEPGSDDGLDGVFDQLAGREGVRVLRFKASADSDGASPRVLVLNASSGESIAAQLEGLDEDQRARVEAALQLAPTGSHSETVIIRRQRVQSED